VWSNGYVLVRGVRSSRSYVCVCVAESFIICGQRGPSQFDDFYREKAALTALSGIASARCVRLLKCWDPDAEENMGCLVLERGRADVVELLRDLNALESPDAVYLRKLEVARGLVQVVESLHRAGWMHCDLSCLNVLNFPTPGGMMVLKVSGCHGEARVGLCHLTAADVAGRGPGQRRAVGGRMCSHVAGDRWQPQVHSTGASLSMEREREGSRSN
jgi:hypothetical protein